MFDLMTRGLINDQTYGQQLGEQGIRGNWQAWAGTAAFQTPRTCAKLLSGWEHVDYCTEYGVLSTVHIFGWESGWWSR